MTEHGVGCTNCLSLSLPLGLVLAVLTVGYAGLSSQWIQQSPEAWLSPSYRSKSHLLKELLSAYVITL